MKKVLVAATYLGIVAGSAQAGAMKPKEAALWQCSDYLSMDAFSRPVALGFLEARNKKGQEDAVLDIEKIRETAPRLIEICNENPKYSIQEALENCCASKK